MYFQFNKLDNIENTEVTEVVKPKDESTDEENNSDIENQIIHIFIHDYFLFGCMSRWLISRTSITRSFPLRWLSL